MRDLETRTLDTSIETIRERIDKLGVTEPVIQKYGLGANQILVELPGDERSGDGWKRSFSRRRSCRFMRSRAGLTIPIRPRCRPMAG